MMSSTRRASRWLVGLLAVVLAALSGYAMFGGWRQANIVDELAVDSANTDAYQQTAYLVSWEMALIQASLREPDGEERDLLPDVHEQTQQAMDRMATIDTANPQTATRLMQAHRGLKPQIDTYLGLIDTGDQESAEEQLEERIEPAANQIIATVLAEQQHHLDEHATRQASGQRESRQLVWGSGLAFVTSLLVLVLFAWSARAHQRQVETLAATDALTGLPNRRAFVARTATALADDASHRRRSKRPRPARATVLVVNLDGFRDVNDQLGHRIGDLLLAHVSRRLKASVRAQDFVARLGSDEFAILLRDNDPAIGESIAGRLADAFGEPFVIDDITLDLEASVGAATARPGEDTATLLRHADTAMNLAKQQRLGFRRYATGHTEDSNARLTLLGDLRRALDTTGEITLHYQPKIDIDGGMLAGVEALARWQHPTKGAVSPGEFIPVLEATTLIHKFTHQVLTQALTQARTWLDQGHRVPVAVNVSTRSLLDTGFPDRVAILLEQSGVPGDQLGIEVTENSIMSDPDTAIDALHRLRALGVKISVDDYGTGYSSMTYLRLLPLDELKIDRSFVLGMNTDRGNRALVASTVELGHNLGLTVVAEGIEDASTLTALGEIGCDLAQGYHLARPMPAHAITHILAQHAVPAA
jgi:diguanylate cyclase (GGDEF)-like protein